MRIFWSLCCTGFLVGSSAVADHLGIEISDDGDRLRVTAAVTDAPRAHLLAELTEKAGIEAVGLERLGGRASLHANGERIESALRRILRGDTYLTRHRSPVGGAVISALAVLQTGTGGRLAAVPAAADPTPGPVPRNEIRALAHRRNADTRKELLRLATSSADADTRATAARALLIFADQLDSDAVKALLASNDGDVRLAGIRILGRSEIPEAASLLVEELDRADVDDAASVAAVTGLASLGGKEALDALREVSQGGGALGELAKGFLVREERR